MRSEEKFEIGQHETLLNLLDAHQALKNQVDKLFAEAWRTTGIESIMEIRSLNAKCISKYTDLTFNSELILEASTTKETKKLFSIGEDYDLWKLNEQLSRLVPLYQEAMRNSNISGFVRMVISFNFENILRVKENLLHPVDESLAV